MVPDARGTNLSGTRNETTNLLIQSNRLTQETEAVANDTLSAIGDQSSMLQHVMGLMGIIGDTNRDTVHATRAFAAESRRKTRQLWMWFVALSALNVLIVARVLWNGRIL